MTETRSPYYDETVGKHRHEWTGGWTMDCARCGVGEYDTSTKYCEDVAIERAEREAAKVRKEQLRVEALAIVHNVLSPEQCEALGLPKPERKRDYIRVGK